MGLYSADFLTCHCMSQLPNRLPCHHLTHPSVLLFILSPPMLIPYFDRLHATMLFWLAPNQQIRPPIYSFKQRSTRRKIVMKCE